MGQTGQNFTQGMSSSIVDTEQNQPNLVKKTSTTDKIDQIKLNREARRLRMEEARKQKIEREVNNELAGIKGLQALRDRVVASSGKRNPTLRDFVEITGRGTIREFPVFCGTPKRVADEMQAWVEASACDGFVLAATHMPGTYEEFVRLVVPELQRRGVFRKEFTGTTLRENLGLPRAAPFDWQR